MTNNPTIDGVSRELLQNLLHCGDTATTITPFVTARIREILDRQPVALARQRKMRIYIAGPMTGIEDYNFPAFNAMAAQLRSVGWHVENPAEHGIVDGADWADYLRYDISRLSTCEAMMLLRGWSASKGAQLEVSIAKKIGIVVMFAEDAEDYTAPPEVAALQSTIAQLQARVQELESGKGEIAGFRYRANGDWEWMDESPFADGRTHYKLGGEELQPLYTAPPAPVGHTMKSVMSAVCAITGFPMLTSNQCHALAQSLNACLDATAALNGPDK